MEVTDEMVKAFIEAIPHENAYVDERGDEWLIDGSFNVRAAIKAALAAAPASTTEPTMVPIHADGNWVFIDGPGDVELDHGGKMRSRIEALETALGDLLTWFPDQPSPPEWRLRGGDKGADDAVAHARSVIGLTIDT